MAVPIVMRSDSDISTPSTPSGSATSQCGPGDADTSITTFGGASCDNSGDDARRESVDMPSVQGDHDEKQHPKGKRKRTAAKDKAILEEAYRSNPKPDKWARLEIVERVSLNEKEVQIWFQNRRQNDRRKSRPLSPQELAALQSGSMQVLSSESFYAPYSHGHHGAPPASVVAAAGVPVPAVSRPGHYTAPMSSNASRQQQQQQQQQLGVAGEDMAASPGAPGAGFPGPRDGEGPPRHIFPANPGHWNARNPFPTLNTPSFSPGRSSSHRDPYGRPISPTTVPTLSLAPGALTGNHAAHPRPQARISLSFDGKAELVPERGPSPPHLPPPMRSHSAAALPGLPLAQPMSHPAQSALQRSHSALSLPNVTLPPISTLTDSLPTSATASSAPSPAFVPPRLGPGRSLDAHAWELCADAKACDELTTQAENEASGSALAAISLIRSTGSVQQTGQPKRSAVLADEPTSCSSPSKRPKLGRFSTSVSRPHSLTALLSPEEEEPVPDGKGGPSKMDVSMLLAPTANDANKENWYPDEDGIPRQTAQSEQPMQPRPRRPMAASSLLAREHLLDEADRAAPPTPVSPQRLPAMMHDLDSSVGHVSHSQHQQQQQSHHSHHYYHNFYQHPHLHPHPGQPTAMPSLFRRNSVPVPQRGLLGKRRPGEDGRLGIFHEGSGGSSAHSHGERARRRSDEDIEPFMQGKEVSPSKRSDLDCVTGLLRLRQGNWR